MPSRSTPQLKTRQRRGRHIRLHDAAQQQLRQRLIRPLSCKDNKLEQLLQAIPDAELPAVIV